MSTIVFFSHETALEIHHYAAISRIKLAKSRIGSLPDNAPSRARVDSAISEIELKYGTHELARPVHYLVTGGQYPKPNESLKAHGIYRGLPPNSFDVSSRSTRVSNVPLSLLECTYEMSEPKAALLAYEVCGTYRSLIRVAPPLGEPSKDCYSNEKANASTNANSWTNACTNSNSWTNACTNSNSWTNTYTNSQADAAANELISDAPPLAKTSEILAYINKSRSLYGAGKLSRVLRFVCDNSASPRESKLAIVLCMPMSKGGAGIPKPLMNFEIKCTEEAKCISGKSSLRCDLFWPKAQLAVEYQSYAHHAGDQARIKDSRRKNALESMGIRVIEVTNEELNLVADTSVIAGTIKDHLGMDKRCWTSNYARKQMELRREIGLPVKYG